MQIKLIDVRTEHVEEETFGTCELCMYTAPDTNYFYQFRTEDGDEFEVEGSMWSYGDKFEVFIENIPAFAAWLQEQDVEPPENPSYQGYSWLNNLVLDFGWDRDEEGDEWEPTD